MRSPCQLKDSENVHTVRIWKRWKSINGLKCTFHCPFCKTEIIAYYRSMAYKGKRCHQCKAILQKGFCYQWRDWLGEDSVKTIRTPDELSKIEHQGKIEYDKLQIEPGHTHHPITENDSLELLMYYATFGMYWEHRRVATRQELRIRLVMGPGMGLKLHRRYQEMKVMDDYRNAESSKHRIRD